MSQASDAHPLDSSSTSTAPQPDLLLSLPDVPTLAILSLLPLQQLIVNLPLVHPRLAPIRASVLKGTQRLVLHIGDQKEIKGRQFKSQLRLPFAGHLVDSTGALLYPKTDFYTLHLATLDDGSVEQLISLMPAIVHLQLTFYLTFSHECVRILPRLATLLSHWAPTLQSLQLNIGYVLSGETLSTDGSLMLQINTLCLSNLRLLIREINSKLRALQTLTLAIDLVLSQNNVELFQGGQTGVPLRLSILGQLRHFNLDLSFWPGAPSFLLEQLEAYASEKLTHIGLGGDYGFNWNAVANSGFAGRFTHVPVQLFHASNFTLLLPSFSNLKVYAFYCQRLSSQQLVDHLRALSSLPHLQCIKVHGFSPVSHPLAGSPTDLPSLPSVTVLEISIRLQVNGNHDYLQTPYWSTLFLSVQILKVTHYGHFCAICYPDDRWNARQVITDYAQVTPCLRQLFAPLAVLPSLKKIFYQREGQSDLIAEFTPQGDFVRTHEYIC